MSKGARTADPDFGVANAKRFGSDHWPDTAGYAVAVISVALAAVGRWLVDPVLSNRHPFITFVLAVLVTAYVGNVRHTAVAAILGLWAGWYFFIPERFTLQPPGFTEGMGMMMYGIVAGAITLFTGSLRAAERRSFEQADRLRATLFSIGDAVITTDAQGRVTAMNPLAETLTGWKLPEALGRPLEEVFRIINVNTGEPVINPVARVLDSGIVAGLANHTILISRDGARRPIDDSAAPIHDSRGATAGVILVFRDVSERENAEITTRRLAAIVESSDDAIISKDLNGIVTSWNDAAERIFGYSAQEMVGQSIERLIPEDRRDEEPSILQRLARGERVDHYETVRRRKDGQRIDVSLTISPIRNSAGAVIGASKIARDITQQVRNDQEKAHLLDSERAARGEAERASRMRDEFLSVVSHELRTPLNGILGWAQLLRRNAHDSQMWAEGISAIEQGARAQAQLINDLLDMHRVLAGKLLLDVQNVHLSTVIDEALSTLRPAAEAKNIRLHSALATNIAPIKGDPTRLQQVVWNLVSNAVKFTPHGGQVQVLLEQVASQVEISVTDNGAGIAADFLPHVFERFRQADSGTSRRYGGLGLGLAIVKQIVDLHGGSVSAESEGPGNGSTFRVHLPVAVAQATAVSELAPDDSTRDRTVLDRIRVLVVDDDPGAAEILSRMLVYYGADTVTSTSGEEALSAISESGPDLILCDIGMPGMDGYELIRTLRGRGSRIPAVAVTAFARPEDRIRTLQAGYNMHLSKPIEEKELVTVVQSMVRMSAASAA